MTEMKVHPVADLFPMMSDDELQDLAADIKANGQSQPAVVDEANGEPVLIDGRNRLKACQIAGVKLRTEPLNGRDPVDLIWSNNAVRKERPKGVLAILAAKALPFRRPGKKQTSPNSERFAMVSPQRLSEARIILEFAPDLAAQVLSGSSTPFYQAFEEARRRKVEAETNEQKMARLLMEAPDLADLAGMSLQAALDKLEQRKADAAKLKTIEDDAPDLVRLVNEGRMSVTEALGAFHAKQEELRNAQSGATTLLSNIVQLIDVGVRNPKEVAARLMENVTAKMWPQDADELTPELLKACGEMLIDCSKILKTREGKK